MKFPSSIAGKIRTKAVWGSRTALTAFLAVSFAVVSASVSAGPANGKGPQKKQHAKLDQALNKLADGVGDTDVIVEFNDDTDSLTRITGHGGRAGRKLGLIKGRAARISNALLKRLADDPKVKRVHLDRDVTGDIARTAVTVGAK